MEHDRDQFYADSFYMQHGPCCAGCDHWRNINTVLGECTKSKLMSEREAAWGAIGWNTLPDGEKNSHALTKRGYHCALFEDTFDWNTLPLLYLKRIGCTTDHPVRQRRPTHPQTRLAPQERV